MAHDAAGGDSQSQRTQCLCVRFLAGTHRTGVGGMNLRLDGAPAQCAGVRRWADYRRDRRGRGLLTQHAKKVGIMMQARTPIPVLDLQRCELDTCYGRAVDNPLSCGSKPGSLDCRTDGNELRGQRIEDDEQEYREPHGEVRARGGTTYSDTPFHWHFPAEPQC